MGARDMDIYLDRMLVVNQMKGIFKVKNRDLWPMRQSTVRLMSTSRVPQTCHKWYTTG